MLKSGDWVSVRASHKSILPKPCIGARGNPKRLFKIITFKDNKYDLYLEYFDSHLKKVSSYILYKDEVEDPAHFDIIIDETPKFPCLNCGCFCEQLCYGYVKK